MPQSVGLPPTPQSIMVLVGEVEAFQAAVAGTRGDGVVLPAQADRGGQLR